MGARRRLLAVILALSAACTGGGGGSAGSPGSSPTGSAASGHATTPEHLVLAHEGPLAPGEYESGDFGRRFSVRLRGGWEAAHLGPRVVLLVRAEADLGVFLPDGVATVAELRGRIRTIDGATVRERGARSLAGHTAARSWPWSCRPRRATSTRRSPQPPAS